MSVPERKNMINNSSFRRSANCGKFGALISGKQIETFPIKKIGARDLTQSWIDNDGFEKPVLIENVKGLGMKLPDSSTKLSDIAAIIGSDFPIKIISVGEQTEIAGNIGDYAYYMANRTADHKLLNLISLEISATRLSGKVQSPNLVREIDWIDKCWPLDRRARGDFPQVQKYCLCGMAGSYTDFHVDFGGTSVWYHVLSGQKRFYLVEPTTSNLKAFEQWTCSKTQDTVFFGDVIGLHNCYQIDLLAGQTLLIPGAWIHAVYTPLDSLVFGGNFLHSFNIVRQLQVYGMEQRTFVHKQYRFPQFKLVNWFVLCSLLPIAKKRLMATTDGESKAPEPEKNDSDSDEDDGDLINLCDSIKSPSVFRQFPYLVRTCEFWLLVLDDEEYTAFTKAAQEVWCDDAKGVINLWWEILLSLADSMSPGQEVNKYRKHVETVRDVKVFDLLNDKVVGPAFKDLSDVSEEEDDDDDMFGSDKEDDANEEAINFDEDKKEINDIKLSIQKQNISDFKNEKEVIEKSSFRIKLKNEKEEEKHSLRIKLKEEKEKSSKTKEEEKPPLKFKFKLKNYEEQEEQEEGFPSEEGSSEEEEEEEKGSEEEEENTKVTEPLKFKFQIPNLSTKNLSAPSSSSSESLKFDINIGSSSSSSRMAQQSARLRGKRIDAGKGKSLMLDTKKIGTSVVKASAKRKVRKMDDYELDNSERIPTERPNHEFDASNILPDREGGGGGRYGTRGKRVSAAFLLHAEDVDIRDIVGEDKRAEMSLAASSVGSSGLHNDDEDDIPFMFDDYVDIPAGDEDYVVGRGEMKEDEESAGEGEFNEEEDSDFDGGDDEEEVDVGRKRGRENSQKTSNASSTGTRVVADVPKRSNVKTSRQLLMAKFR